MTKISIITPVFNREDCISRCIESVLMQSGCILEHIIIDDGSTDNTQIIVEKYSSEYSSIIHLPLKKNMGVNYARNRGIEISSGDYILFLDSDDFLADDALQFINKTINKNIKYLHFLFIQSDRLSYVNSNNFLKAETVELKYYDWLKGNMSGDFVHVIRNSVFDQIKFDENYRIYEEMTFLKIYKKTKTQLFNKKLLVNRERNRADSISREYLLYKKQAREDQFNYLMIFFNELHSDYEKFNLLNELSGRVNRIIILGLALGKYCEIGEFINLSNTNFLSVMNYCIYKLRLGMIYKIVLICYSFVKNIVFSSYDFIGKSK